VAGINLAVANEIQMIDSDAAGNITVTYGVLVNGPTTDLMSFSVPVTITAGQSNATILSNTTTAIVNACAGVGITVARSAVLIQNYQRGQ
jgi:hypothetical protein